ncbi:BCCT family transporter [Ornithinimicrobium avium]|uniref:BCCT family transporter n=1 Tax=Ornithinimicrobium avium TaxID=2283195 RepID=A0A345NR30_9MICO|nr:BCCT family transporter [Ornithinimicrobium avium]AXH97488.1 BCCT family transporter [Ornithinimicrobium avium]
MTPDDDAGADHPDGTEQTPAAEVPSGTAPDIPTEEVLAGLLAEQAGRTVHLPPSVHIHDEDPDEVILRKLASHGVHLNRGMIAPRVFWPSLVVVLGVVVFAVVAPELTSRTFGGMNSWIVNDLGWYYMLVVSGLVFVAIGIAVSRYGRIPLGRPGDEPEFGVLSWFAMLFAAGMGIGLVFYSVGEPLTYAFTDPKPGWIGDQSEMAGNAMAQTFLHWGLHPWAIYAVVGLALSYAIHRRGRPVSIRWALEPLFGDRVKGWVGDVIDVLAVVGTLFGIATSLGLGVQQISTGMAAIGIVDETDNVLLVILIVVITLLATVSVVSGVGAGIKWLSNGNLTLAGILLISVAILGPTVFLFENLIQALGIYLGDFFQMSFDVGAYQRSEEASSWFAGWTIFYWGWWISWSPFVGVFIARISRGRTIRQFIAGVLLVPTIVGFLWFSVLGGTGLFQQMYQDMDLVGSNLDADGNLVVEGLIFAMLENLPLGGIFSFVAILLVAIFFITSSDSGSLVVDMLASGGHPDPPTWSRVLFAALEGLVAAVLLLAGGLTALQAGALATALPFSVVLILMVWATIRALRNDVRVAEQEEFRARLARVTEEVARSSTVGDLVDDRIDYRLSRTRNLLSRGERQAQRRRFSAFRGRDEAP